jgi:hypothetical protein
LRTGRRASIESSSPADRARPAHRRLLLSGSAPRGDWTTDLPSTWNGANPFALRKIFFFHRRQASRDRLNRQTSSIAPSAFDFVLFFRV